MFDSQLCDQSLLILQQASTIFLAPPANKIITIVIIIIIDIIIITIVITISINMTIPRTMMMMNQKVQEASASWKSPVSDSLPSLSTQLTLLWIQYTRYTLYYVYNIQCIHSSTIIHCMPLHLILS